MDSEGAGVGLAFPKVEVVQARSMELRPRFELVGQVVPRPEAEVLISSRVASSIAEVLVAEGNRVEAGIDLFRLNTELFEIAVERARAAAEKSRAILDRLEKGPLPQELEIASKRVLAAEVLVRSATLKLAALEDLETHGELSPVRHANARSLLESAQADLSSAQANRSLLRAGTRPESLREARASVDIAAANLREARLRLGFGRIQAPISGTITDLQVRAGQAVQDGTVLLTLVDLSSPLFRVRVPARDLPGLTPGLLSTITFDELEEPVAATLDRIGANAESTRGGLWVYLSLSNPGILRSGSRGKAALYLPTLENCTVIPRDAIAERAGVPVTTRIVEGRAHEIEIRTGVRVQDWVQVLEGVAVGDWIAVSGGYGLPDDQPVDVQ